MRKALIILALLSAWASCSRPLPDGTPTDKASVEASAWTVADSLVACDHKDTLAMQACLLEAHARKSRFLMAGKEDAAQIFDEAFEQRLRERDSQLHDIIFEP